MDKLLSETLDLTFRASYSSGLKKLDLVSESVIKNDLPKFFLTIMWECKVMEDKKYKGYFKIYLTPLSRAACR